MGASESFRGGCKSASRMTLTLLSVPPPKADCQDTQVCKLKSKEKPKIANLSPLWLWLPCAAVGLDVYDVCLRTHPWRSFTANNATDRVSWRRSVKPFGASLQQDRAAVVNVLADPGGLSVVMMQISSALMRLLHIEPCVIAQLPSFGSTLNQSTFCFSHGWAGHWFRAF
ncbi:hypothetical protein [Synechococcus sp. BIOS-E4-1]|uniref:hypothetical protein n=1 Tax=Synechococcus sp. BIOS-E4-1 TaxID=1400864 RepID=UPI001644A732|nr:hypothetical protein [Synechococcus sp. BIOS-E4-1]